MSLADKIRAAGVVGAGGAGFPHPCQAGRQGRYRHRQWGRVQTVAAQGCRRHGTSRRRGRGRCANHHGGRGGKGWVHRHQSQEPARGGSDGKRLPGTPVRVHLLGDYYPAGDEYDLVHEVTRRLIPPAGIPLQVGVVVANVETLMNVAAAVEGRPVTHKTLTLAGAVRQPLTLTVPIGTTFRDALEAAGGVGTNDPVLCIGGLMMGETTDNLDTPITKTTTGVVVLPRSHHIVERKLKPAPVKPALANRPAINAAIARSIARATCSVTPWSRTRSCAVWRLRPRQRILEPMGGVMLRVRAMHLIRLPGRAVSQGSLRHLKIEMRHTGLKWTGPMTVKPHPMREGRRVPIKTLMKKLHLQSYDHPAPWRKSRSSRGK